MTELKNQMMTKQNSSQDKTQTQIATKMKTQIGTVSENSNSDKIYF